MFFKIFYIPNSKREIVRVSRAETRLTVYRPLPVRAQLGLDAKILETDGDINLTHIMLIFSKSEKSLGDLMVLLPRNGCCGATASSTLLSTDF